MKIYENSHQMILQKSQELKKSINTKEFCRLHGISESTFSRFPSDKLIRELMLFDYMKMFLEEKTDIYTFNDD